MKVKVKAKVCTLCGGLGVLWTGYEGGFGAHYYHECCPKCSGNGFYLTKKSLVKVQSRLGV